MFPAKTELQSETGLWQRTKEKFTQYIIQALLVLSIHCSLTGNTVQETQRGDFTLKEFGRYPLVLINSDCRCITLTLTVHLKTFFHRTDIHDSWQVLTEGMVRAWRTFMAPECCFKTHLERCEPIFFDLGLKLKNIRIFHGSTFHSFQFLPV